MKERLCLWQGSCGYGSLDKEKWPYWSVGALATSNMFYEQGPVQGCGYVMPQSLISKRKASDTLSDL